MKRKLFILMRIMCNIVYILFAIIVIVCLILTIWQNIKFKPIKTNDSDSVEKIEILFSDYENAISYKPKIIKDKNLIEDFSDKTGNVKAKKIINGGGGNGKYIIFVKVYCVEGELKQYTIYGRQILLKEGTEAYQMSESDSQEIYEYFLQFYEDDDIMKQLSY